MLMVGAGWSVVSIGGTLMVAQDTPREARVATLAGVDLAAILTAAVLLLLLGKTLSHGGIQLAALLASVPASLVGAALAVRWARDFRQPGRRRPRGQMGTRPPPAPVSSRIGETRQCHPPMSTAARASQRGRLKGLRSGSAVTAGSR